MGIELEQKIVDTVAERLVGLLSDRVFMIAGLLLVAATISVLWTAFAKAQIADGEGGDLEDRKIKWRIRKTAFWAGTVPAYLLLMVFLPELTPDEWPLWAELVVRALVAASLAPIAGLASPFWWLLLAKWIGPLFMLAWRALANTIAERAFGRKGQMKQTPDGGTGFKPDATAEDPNPKTEIIERGQKVYEPRAAPDDKPEPPDS